MKMLRTVHLRDGSTGGDRAIMDSMELLEAGLAPGYVSNKMLQKRWNVCRATICKRIKAVHKVGLIVIEFQGWGYELSLGPELLRQQQEEQVDDDLDGQFRRRKW